MAAERRRQLGLTQEDLAAATGLSVRSIRELESGRVAQPRPSTIRLLTKALDLPAADRSADAPAAGPVRPAQLPLDLSAFVGRGAQLAALDALLEAGTRRPNAVIISTLSGMAGVGKTSLALHWAHRMTGRFPDGQLYVNLRGFDDGDVAVDPAVALRGFLEALDVPPNRIPSSLEAGVGLYRSLLADRRVLVVLDNARDADQVRPLLPGTGGSLVVVTSRDLLSSLIAAECARSLTVEVLAEQEAVDLLAGRLGAGRLDAEPAAVADIVAGTGRLPLALSIVAAHIATHPTFPLAAFAAELRQAGSGLGALADGGVRRAFSSSYRALSPAAARLFRLLGLHPGPDLTADAAVALAGGAPATIAALLRELTRLHLLTEHRPGRFSLHDLLRVYAAELARSDEPESGQRAARGRLYDFYLQTSYAAARLLQPQWPPITPLPSRSGGGARRLTGHDAALAWFAAEDRVLLGAVRQAAEASFEAHAWQLAWTLTAFFSPRGLWSDQLAVQRIALAAAERIGDLAGQAVANRMTARAVERLGDHDAAERHLQRALRLYERLGDATNQAQTLHNHAELCYHRGSPQDGIEHGLAALELYRAAGNTSGEARTLNAVGWLYATVGDYARAIESCGAALENQRRSGDRNGQAASLDSLGYAYDRLADHPRAVQCYEAAVRLFRESADRYHEAETLTRLGEALATVGDTGAATEVLRGAVRIYEELGDPAAELARRRLRELAPA
ncbi:tetratricopeptide repeat protein [Actinoplanes sp. NPDC049118]|uniref:ATP-binding protein n=1 Tax=Actinoplanes sp. NPDC049118 TaxID=3155769 RepID=UPI0033E16EF5